MLSAAHCFEGKEPSDIEIVLGQHDLTETGETTLAEETVAVEKIINHPNYTFPPIDITILVLAEEVDITIYNTVCLPEKGAKFAGQNARQ